MVSGKSWQEKLGGLFRVFSDGKQNALEILSRHYVEESQQSRRIAYHADRMQYPHFRDKLRAISADEDKHAKWLEENIRALDGTPPVVPEISYSDKNSWESLLADLEEHRQCAAELLMQISQLREDFPRAADTLQRIYDEGARHREEIRAMLMRSDPQAHMAG